MSSPWLLEGADCGEYRRAAGAIAGSRNRLAPSEPCWRRRFWRGRVWTGRTGASTEPVNQALLQSCITALRATAAIAIYIEAPGTVLRLSGFFNADEDRDNSKNE